jgi:hypothetical protein
MLWTKPNQRVRKILTLLVLTLGLTAGSLATSVAPAEAHWAQHCHREWRHHHWVHRCYRY